MTISAYPLQWPEGWPRTPAERRGWAKFEKITKTYNTESGRSERSGRRVLSVADGAARVSKALDLMGLGRDDIVVSTNVRLRLDGMPRSNEPEPSDPGVAVYWQTRKGGRKVMAIDRYARVADNLAAIAATLEAMRGIERWGGGQILDRAFSGFTALPAPGQTHARGWREVLNVEADVNDLDTVKGQYRRLSSVRHPDKGGTEQEMAELNWAWAQAQEALAARH